MSEWQPIETAPKNGEWVILHYDVEHIPSFAFWSKHEKRWMLQAGVVIQNFIPTNWMPLPDPPASGVDPKGNAE